jgi:membrane-associated protein
MEWVAAFLDIVLHLDVHLTDLLANYGRWVYLILFVVIFAETGFVVTPFLPGDSLLFVAGALAALGGDAGGAVGMDIWALTVALTVAAITGNMLNYQIGRFLGPRVFQWESSRFFNREALMKTQAFYEQHGGKTLVLSRFLPVFRTFAPFVAGVGGMVYGRFFFYNAMGAIAWIFSLSFAGYWFGNVPWVRVNLSFIIVAIVLISFLPVFVAWVRHRLAVTRDMTGGR